MYETLAPYYDALLSDEETLNEWLLDFIKTIRGNRVLDMACGSGEAAKILALKGYVVDAFDLSNEMILEAKKKTDKVSFSQQDMRKFSYDHQFDGVICLVDSLNYINTLADLKQVFIHVYNHLNDDGIFQFDYHQIARLKEFEEEYIEEGLVLGIPYQWTIVSENNQLLERFVFWNEDGQKIEHHIQTIFEYDELNSLLLDVGFKNISCQLIGDEKYMIRGIK